MKTPIFCTMMILGLCCLAASTSYAQETYEYSRTSSIEYYDDGTSAVYGYSATEIDYACSDNYSAYVEGYLKNQYGTTLDSGYDVHPYLAEVYTSASADPDSYYTVESYHEIIARFYDDEIEKSPDGCWPCDGCNTDCYYFQDVYYWWDPYGFSSSGHTGNYGSWASLFGEGPSIEVPDDEYFDLGETSDALITPAQGVTFTTAKIYQGDQAAFTDVASIPTAVLNATESQCNPYSDFTLTVNYSPPSDTREIYSVVAKGFGNTSVSNWYVHPETINNNYNLNVTPHTGTVSMTVNNKNGGRTGSPYDVIQVTVKGAYNSGESFSSLGKVRIQCP